MKSGIYKITNEVTGKFYIGSSEDIDKRWEIEHKGNLIRNQHCNPKLQNSWNFYGGDKFSMSIIEETESKKELLLEREQYYLDTFKPYIQGIGYNICPKACGGDNITHNPNRDAFIEKMSGISAGENNPMFGKKHSESSIQLQKQKSIGRYTLDWFIQRNGKRKGTEKFENRNMILRNRKMNYSYDNKMKGTKRGPMSEEVKKRISERKAHLKNLKPELHKDILSEQFTISQLQEKYGTSKATILNERRKLTNRI
jgi:group I intron endonuclease